MEASLLVALGHTMKMRAKASKVHVLNVHLAHTVVSMERKMRRLVNHVLLESSVPKPARQQWAVIVKVDGSAVEVQ